MPVLLISLGTSWPIVPEAFHLLPPAPDGFSAVHVLTTSSTETDAGVSVVAAYFSERFPDVSVG